MDVAGLVEEVDAELRALGVPARAEKEKAYLKSDLQFYGVDVPGTRRVAVRALRHHGDVNHDQLLALVDVLWSEPVHERRRVAVELLRLRADLLGAADVPLLERLLRESRTWALVDDLAIRVVGPLVEEHDLGATLDRWVTDDDLWIRRSALLALLLPARDGDRAFERFCRYADRLLQEREFFIRKAIGWVLRDVGRRHPDRVYEWLLPRAARASAVTLREAVKPLSDEQRAAVLTAANPR